MAPIRLACTAAGMAALTAMSTIALAAPNRTTPQRAQPVTIGLTTINVPLPAGFCIATSPEDKLLNQMMADGDRDNYTPLIASECGKGTRVEDRAEYFMLKAPKAATMQTTRRGATLTQAARAFASSAVDVNAAAPKAGSDMSAEISKHGKDMKLGMTADAGFRGRDDVCVYVGGIVDVAASVQQKPITYKIAFGSCVTAVDQKLLSVNWYSYDLSPATQAALMAKAKKLVVAMSGNRPQ